MASDDPVTTISESLKETDELPRKQISEIIEALGVDEALALLAETRRVQDEGGVEVRDGTRRRTDGGVFFSLAKAKLPKAERNRIFRVKVPKPPGEPDSEREAESAAPVSKATPSVEQRRPPKRAEPPRVDRAADANGRRRVVEIEVLRHKPGSVAASEVRAPWPPREAAPVREPQPAAPEVRPMRRIVTVAPTTRSEAPSTPEAARERIRELLKALGASDQKRVLADVLRELGGLAEFEPRRAPEPKKPPPPPPPAPEPRQGLTDSARERVLAAVTDALGLSTTDLARVLYGEETAGTKAKARTVLDRWRRT